LSCKAGMRQTLSFAAALWQTCAMKSEEVKIHGLPCWNGAIEISALKGGLSNTNYLVSDANGKHVVRFGVDYPFHHVSRAQEVMVARAAHAAGFAPAVEYSETGVMVTQYLGAKTYEASDVKSNAARIGKLIRNFHFAMPKHVTGAAQVFWVFHVIRDYINTLNKAGSLHQQKFATFQNQAEALENAQQPLPIVFGHHDFLPANFLDDGEKIWLIDFEYAGYGTAMFDLAGTSSNAQMNMEEQQDLLVAYFGKAPDAKLQKSFAAMECASLLRETLWAMVSGLFLAAPGVDYDAYTIENLQRYQDSLEAYQNQYGKIQS
jgi:thiamine kinase-like enzyme